MLGILSCEQMIYLLEQQEISTHSNQTFMFGILSCERMIYLLEQQEINTYFLILLFQHSIKESAEGIL